MKRAVLPCNGLDKQYGVLARELALKISETQDAQIICPVLLNTAPAIYEKTLADVSVLVVDGCSTRCASKLAGKIGLKVNDKVIVSERAKSAGLDIGESLRIGQVGMHLVDMILTGLSEEKKVSVADESVSDFESPANYLTVTHNKYNFKIPTEGYFFNENDCWVKVIGSRARVGVSDFVQQNMTDITFFEPAQVGLVVEQFDEVGSIESGKSMMDVLSPVSGRIIAVNTQLAETPELVNEDPYGKGWVAEIELRDFDSDKELLLKADSYSTIVKKKATEAEH